MQKKLLMTAMAIATFCLGGTASATTASWTGDFSSDFMAPLNWTSQAVPGAGDILTVSPGSYYQPVFSIDPAATTSVASVYIGSGAFLTITSGTLRGTSNTADSGSYAVYNGTTATDGVLVNGGTLRSDNNLYIGRGNGSQRGRLTMTSGRIQVGGAATTTVGYQSGQANIGGVLNVWGGTADLGSNLRIDATSVNSKDSSGRIDIRGDGVVIVDVTNVSLTMADYLISKGRFVSGPGYGVVASLYDANNVMFKAEQIYYATNPSPVDVNVVQSSTQTLSWVKPQPRNPGDTVTSNVYFGTNVSSLPQIASGITGESIQVSTVHDQLYYWRVDCVDPNGGNPVTTQNPYWSSNPWSFGTFITPTVSVGITGSRQVAFQRAAPDPNSDVTIVASASDDGYPSALTYYWTAISPQDVNTTFLPSRDVLTPNVVFNTPTAPNTSTWYDPDGGSHQWSDGYYHLLLTASDGFNPVGWAVLTVRVFPHPTGSDDPVYCEAMKWVGFTPLAGDIDQDCKVGATDLAQLVYQWLVCNSLECQ